MPHPLDGAYLRVEWAGTRLEELERCIRVYAEREIEANDVDTEFHPGGQVVLTLSPMGDPPRELAVILGEVVYHLRSALDYLVFELAKADSGEPRGGTQFPIESTPVGFSRRRATYLLGVSKKHVDAIERLQPCKGCDWTRDLAAISNPDKHRQLHGTLGSQAAGFIATFGTIEQLEGAPGKMKPLRNDPAGRYVKVHHEVSEFSVTFGDGQPGVKEILELLTSKVAQTVNAFKQCFEGACPH